MAQAAVPHSPDLRQAAPFPPLRNRRLARQTTRGTRPPLLVHSCSRATIIPALRSSGPGRPRAWSVRPEAFEKEEGARHRPRLSRSACGRERSTSRSYWRTTSFGSRAPEQEEQFPRQMPRPRAGAVPGSMRSWLCLCLRESARLRGTYRENAVTATIRAARFIRKLESGEDRERSRRMQRPVRPRSMRSRL